MRRGIRQLLLERWQELTDVDIGSVGDIWSVGQVLDQLEAYFQLLVRWNRKMSLTSLPVEAPTSGTIDRILVEPLAAARYIPKWPVAWLDIGSGGGSPAVPLKIARPAAMLTMIEAKARKCAFLREVVRVLELRQTAVVEGRAEDYRPGGRNKSLDGLETAIVDEPAEVITLRAVRISRTMDQTIDRLTAPHGRFLHFTTMERSNLPVARFELVDAFRLINSPAHLSAAVLKVWQKG